MKVEIAEHGTDMKWSLEGCHRTWIARRVDLIVTPASQYPFSLLGWIGSKVKQYALDLDEYKLTLGIYCVFSFLKFLFILCHHHIPLLSSFKQQQFNRSLRLYAWKELNITINNHEMLDHKVTVNVSYLSTSLVVLYLLYPRSNKDSTCRNCKWKATCDIPTYG